MKFGDDGECMSQCLSESERGGGVSGKIVISVSVVVNGEHGGESGRGECVGG